MRLKSKKIMKFGFLSKKISDNGTKKTTAENQDPPKSELESAGKKARSIKPAAAGRTTSRKALNSSFYRSLSHTEKLKLAINNLLNPDTEIRPLNSNGKPGGLVEFKDDDPREFIIVGDIHANKKNFKAILQDSNNLDKIKNNEAVIVFLGDIVHDERTGHLKEMKSSIEIMDIMLHLINKYPNNIVYILGNHDTMDPQLSKSGITQGVIYREALIEHRGEKYADLMNRFFDLLPVFVMHKYFLAAHGGPVRGGIGRNELINIDNYSNCKHQLIWNRINETHSTPSLKEYSPEDIDELRKALRCPPNIPLFVGHNPMWKWGGNDSVWVNVLRTHDYVILYSGAQKICPYISVSNSYDYQIKYANLKLKQRRFVLDDY